MIEQFGSCEASETNLSAQALRYFLNACSAGVLHQDTENIYRHANCLVQQFVAFPWLWLDKSTLISSAMP